MANRFDSIRIPISENLRVLGNTPYYGANGIQDYVDGYTHDGEYVLIAEDGANDLKNYPIRLVKGRIWVNNHAHVIQGIEKFMNNQFINFAMSQVNFESIVVGCGRAKLNAEQLMDICFKIPNKNEQSNIGRLFESLDHLITLHQSKFFGDILKTIASYTLYWEQRKLGEIGIIITGSTPSTSIKYYYTDDIDEGIVWVTPTDIINNITVESEKRLTSLGQKVAHIVPKNTILVTCIASIGKNTMLIDRGSFNQQINGLIPYENKYEPYFLLTESFIWSNKMKSSAPVGTMQIVNRKEFSEIDADIPDKSEQNSVGAFFRTLDHLITLHQLEPFQMIFKAIAYRIIDYAKSKPPMWIKYEDII